MTSFVTWKRVFEYLWDVATEIPVSDSLDYGVPGLTNSKSSLPSLTELQDAVDEMPTVCIKFFGRSEHLFVPGKKMGCNGVVHGLL